MSETWSLESLRKAMMDLIDTSKEANKIMRAISAALTDLENRVGKLEERAEGKDGKP